MTKSNNTKHAMMPQLATMMPSSSSLLPLNSFCRRGCIKKVIIRPLSTSANGLCNEKKRIVIRPHSGRKSNESINNASFCDLVVPKNIESLRALSTTSDSTTPIIHSTIESIRSVRKSLGPTTSVGFVPTMGALHEGHLSLARAARAENDIVISSIFVNPTQFGQGEDLDKYPRQLEKDADMLREVGVDHIFAPSSEMMYRKNHVTYIDPMGFDKTNEGISRPHHFRGVATVVTKLFNIVQPTNAYFGQKDAVQCVLIRRMVDDLDMDVNVCVMDTVREDDGLAMSSRNAYLTDIEREKAPIVYKALCAAREVFDSRFARGEEEVSADDLRKVVQSVLQTESLITKVQYVSIDDMEKMHPVEKVGSEGGVISLACTLGSVRLIDNIVLR